MANYETVCALDIQVVLCMVLFTVLDITEGFWLCYKVYAKEANVLQCNREFMEAYITEASGVDFKWVKFWYCAVSAQ